MVQTIKEMIEDSMNPIVRQKDMDQQSYVSFKNNMNLLEAINNNYKDITKLQKIVKKLEKELNSLKSEVK